MTPSHGCAGLRGRSWLNTALAALGLCLALTNARPALACPIHHDESSAADSDSALLASIQDVMKRWDDRMNPEPQALASASSATPSTTPSAENWHQSTASSCMPPPPTSACGCSSSTASAQSATSSSPLNPPAPFLNPPAATPEPSTILTALTLAGAFAWRRRKRAI